MLRRLALLRWYVELPGARLQVLEKLVSMSVLRRATTTGDGKLQRHCDVIDASCIWARLLLLQQKPLSAATISIVPAAIPAREGWLRDETPGGRVVFTGRQPCLACRRKC